MPLVLEPVAAVGRAADRERLDDRVARRVLALGADDGAEAARRHHRAGERLLVRVLEGPPHVEGGLGDEARLGRERLERAGLPQRGRVEPAGRRRRAEAGEDVLHVAEVERLGAAEDLDHDGRAGLGDAAGLAQGGDHVVGVEERVEAADGVEAVVDVGELLQVALAEVGVGHALAGDLEQRRRGVETAHRRPVVGGGAEEDAGAAADVEDGLPGTDAGAARSPPRRWGAAGARSRPSRGRARPRPCRCAPRCSLMDVSSSTCPLL